MDNKQKEIDLSKVVLVLKDNRKQIGIVTAVTTLLAIVYCIFATPVFTAKIIINPPKLTDAGSGVLFQALNGLSGLAAGSGGGGLLLQKTDADVTIAILKTTALKDMIINQFNLQKRWEKKDIELTRRALDEKVKFIPDMKSGFVEIDVDDKDPKMAANVANYYNLALGQMISNISYGRSNTKYQFYQSQLTGAESAMNASENNLKVFAESNGFIAGQQVQIVASLSAQLQAQLIVAQAQLQSMSMYASPDNPDYQQLESQIGSYKIQLDNMNVSGTPDPIGIPATRAPALAKKYTNLMREYVLRQEVYKIIVKQYEVNRLDTLSDLAPVGIQVVDPAQAPLYKSNPKRLKIVLGAVVLGALLSSMYFIIRNRKRIIVEINEVK